MNVARAAGRFTLCLASVFAAATAVSACAAPPADEEVGGSEDSLTERDWGRAISYLGGLSYLPWGYTDDGCYARAIYYTMNLAAEGIASNHVYIIAKDSAHGLGATGRWTYHVAPLVSRDNTSELRVLDPVYSSTPLLLRDWYNRQSQWEGTEHAPILKITPGTSYGTLSGTQVPDPQNASTGTFREPPTFASMPSFSIGNVNSACKIMHKYIDADATTTADQKATKHHDLSRDSKRLVTSLSDLGKLAGGANLDPTCTAFAPELASCPVDTRTNNPGSTACCLGSAFWCQSANGCLAPGAPLGDGRGCGLGGNFSHPAGGETSGETSGGNPGGNPGGNTGGNTGGSCPADGPQTNPVTQECCYASAHWCWSHSAGFCAAPGTSRTVDNVAWTCGAGGEWAR